eukprot:1161655-Pelagomonas_calceolata.AAC.7
MARSHLDLAWPEGEKLAPSTKHTCKWRAATSILSGPEASSRAFIARNSSACRCRSASASAAAFSLAARYSAARCSVSVREHILPHAAHTVQAVLRIWQDNLHSLYSRTASTCRAGCPLHWILHCAAHAVHKVCGHFKPQACCSIVRSACCAHGPEILKGMQLPSST